MKKNQVRRVVMHKAKNEDSGRLADEISAFHAQAVERRLNSLSLTTEQKIAVVDKIIANMKSQGIDGTAK